MTENKPVKNFKAGAISVAVWPNTTKEDHRIFHTVTLERSYKDEKGEWHSTPSLRKQDLLGTARLLGQAYDFMQTKDIAPEEEEIEVQG
jgi:hypothetical protein